MGGDATEDEDDHHHRHRSSPPSPSSPRTTSTTSGSTPVVSPERRRLPAAAEARDDQRSAVAVGLGMCNNRVNVGRKLDAYIPAAGVVSVEKMLKMSGISTAASDSIRYASAAAAAAAAAAARGGGEESSPSSSSPGGASSSVTGDDDGAQRRRVIPGRCGCTMLIHCGDYYASYPPPPPPPVPPSVVVDDRADGCGPHPVDSSSGGTDDTTAAAAVVVEDVDLSAASAPAATTEGRNGNGHPPHPTPPPPLVITVDSVRDVVRSTLDAMREVAPTKGVPVAGEDGQTLSSLKELIMNGRDELLTSTGLYETTEGHMTFLRRMMLPMTIALQACRPAPRGDVDGNEASESKTDSQPNGASSIEETRQYHHCTSVDFSLMDVLMGIDIDDPPSNPWRRTVFTSMVENICRLGKKKKDKEEVVQPPPRPSNGDDDGRGGGDEEASGARLEDEVRSLLLGHVVRLCRGEEGGRRRRGGQGKDGVVVASIGDAAGDDDDLDLRDVARRCLSDAVHGGEVGADLEEAVPELFRGVYRGRGGGGGGGWGRGRGRGGGGDGRKRRASGGGRGGGPKRRVKGKRKGKGQARTTRGGRRRAGGATTGAGKTADDEKDAVGKGATAIATGVTGGGEDANGNGDVDADGGPEDHDHDDHHNDDGDDDDTVTAEGDEDDDYTVTEEEDEDEDEDEGEEDADDPRPPPVRVARGRECKVPSSSGVVTSTHVPSPPSPAGRRRRRRRSSSADADGGDDIPQPTLRRSSRRNVPKDRTPDGGMMIDSTTMSREEFERRTVVMNQANSTIRKTLDPGGRSRPSLACLRSKLSPRSLKELIDVFFSRNGSLRREIRDDIDFSLSNDPKYINFGNGDEHLGREDRRYQIGLRKHPVGGKVKTRERVEEIFSRDGIISPRHESLDDIGILVGGTEDQTLHHDVARQFVTWYETMPLTRVSAAEAEAGDTRPHLDGWEIDRVEYNDAMSSPHAPSSILIGLGDSGEVLLGVQKDQIARSSPTEKTCTIKGGCGLTYRIVRENKQVAIIVVPVGCMFTGDFPHCGVRNFQRGTPEDELLVRFNGVVSSVVDGPSSRSRVAKSKAVIEMLCNFPGLSGLSRLHCSTRMHVSDIMIPLNTIGYNDCWRNERDGRCYEEDEV